MAKTHEKCDQQSHVFAQIESQIELAVNPFAASEYIVILLATRNSCQHQTIDQYLSMQ